MLKIACAENGGTSVLACDDNDGIVSASKPVSTCGGHFQYRAVIFSISPLFAFPYLHYGGHIQHLPTIYNIQYVFYFIGAG